MRSQPPRIPDDPHVLATAAYLGATIEREAFVKFKKDINREFNLLWLVTLLIFAIIIFDLWNIHRRTITLEDGARTQHGPAAVEHYAPTVAP